MPIIVNSRPVFPINNRNTEALFEFIVKNLIYNKVEDKYYTHIQLAAIGFGKGDDTNMKYLKQIINDYSHYIEYQVKGKDKKRFNLTLIAQDFPNWNGHSKGQTNNLIKNEPTEKDDFPIRKELIAAIDDEISEARRQQNNYTYEIESFTRIKSSSARIIYDLRLKLEADDYIKVYEGMPLTLVINNYFYNVEALDFETLKGILTIHSMSDVSDLLRLHDSKIIINTIWLLQELRAKLESFNLDDENPLNLILKNKPHQDRISAYPHSTIEGNLDISQKEALNHCITKGITLLWGPPGTGKSHTLSHFLLNSLLAGEKTLVCCTANVAVDSISRTMIQTLSIYSESNSINYKNGNILRVGYTRDPELLKHDYLFPNSVEIKKLRHELDQLYTQISRKIPDTVRKNILAEIAEKKTNLSQMIRQVIQNANIIFCTASSVHTDAAFRDLPFDNLIIDEASMMSVPHFVILTENIKRRLIIAGDFRQLGPVVLSTTGLARKWLKQDLFEFAGLKYKTNDLSHPYLAQLTIQRRFNRAICSIINKPLYEGKLTTDDQPKQTFLVEYSPEIGSQISYIELDEKRGFKCETTKKGSRFNDFSAKFIVNNLIRPLEDHPLLADMKHIGVISPYRAQINRINNLITNANFTDQLFNKLKVGTIHAFQGSEADLLIIDLVESSHEKLGRLYQEDEGNRLLNVAISRARSKLIVVGNIESIENSRGKGNLSLPAVQLLKSLKLRKSKTQFNYQ